MGGMRFEDANEMLRPGYQAFESGYQELQDGKWVVAGLTRMAGCRAKMVHWWFGWLGDISWYRLWHPVDHISSGWEGRENGDYIGASHLVEEHLGGRDTPIERLRVSFHEPAETFDAAKYRASGAFAVCARPGLLDAPIHLGRMCHLMRDTDYGCEMRSRFWLGDIAHRDPTVTIPEAVIREKRKEQLTADFARRLHQHCVEEMGYLADILPTLYKRVTLDSSF
jgi:hypothetical protein